MIDDFPKDQLGLAFLETALVMTILLTLICAGWGLADYAQRALYLDDILEQSVVSGAPKPFRLGSDAQTIELDRSGIERYVNRQVQLVSEKLAALQSDWAGSRYIVHGGYLEMEIDPAGGALRSARVTLLDSRGSLVAHGLEQQLDLTQILQKESERASSVDQYLFAIPDGLYGTNESDVTHLPKGILVAISAGISMSDGLVGSLLESTGKSPFMARSKVTSLRGEMQ